MASSFLRLKNVFCLNSAKADINLKILRLPQKQPSKFHELRARPSLLSTLQGPINHTALRPNELDEAVRL